MNSIVLAALGAFALLAGCGVPTEEGAQTVDRDAVPFELLEPGTTTVSSAPPLPQPEEVTEICFIDPGGRVVPMLVTATDDDSLSAIVASLAEPPEANGFGVPLTTSVAEPELLELTRDRGVIIVDLDPAFTTMAPDDQLTAIGQLVCTLTAQRGVGQIQFSLDGTPIEVPRGDGSLTAEPVVRSDYAELLAE